jgi:hypothetical protein
VNGSFLMILYVASLCVPVESRLCCFAVRLRRTLKISIRQDERFLNNKQEAVLGGGLLNKF